MHLGLARADDAGRAATLGAAQRVLPRQRFRQRELGRVAVREGDAPQAGRLEQMDGTPVGDLRDDQPSQRGQCLTDIQGVREERGALR